MANKNKRNGVIRNKPVHVLIKQRENFLKTCPVCGKLHRYIKGTSFVYCDHVGTEYENAKIHMRQLDERGCEIATALFGKAK